MKIEITLPMPPSVNTAYAGQIRRYKSKQYKKWLELCKTFKNKKYKVSGDEELVVSYDFYSKFYNLDGSIKRKDSSNYIKLTEDYLPNLISGFDDKQIFLHNRIAKHHSDKEIVVIKIWEKK